MTPALWLVFGLVVIFTTGTVLFALLTAPRDKDVDR
jgi:hypothetical protein